MPSPGAGLSTLPSALQALQKQIDRLARRPPSSQPAPVLFSAAGVPPSGTYSPPYKVPVAASSIVLNGLLGTAGGSTTTVGVYAGVTLLASVSLTSGVTDNSSTTTVSVAAGTVVRMLASSVGTGAQDLTVEASFL